ncbi:MAG: hypothetical protein ACRDDZ_09660 [Marinifilaceae bacterium]
MEKRKNHWILAIFSAIIVLGSIAVLGWLGSGVPLELDSLNPIGVIKGAIFTLSFGFGLPVLASAFLVAMCIVAFYVFVDWLLRKIFN